MPTVFADISLSLQQNSSLLIGLTLLLGLLLGSFLNVLIYRLPKMMERDWQADCQTLQGQTAQAASPYNLMRPRSSCPHCQQTISAGDNIPLLSYLLLKGRCRHCAKTISPRYPLVELLSAVLMALVSWQFGYSSLTFFAWLLCLGLIALTFIDFDTQLLPDSLTLPLLWLGLLFNLNLGFSDLNSAVIGAAAGYLLLWSIYWLFKLCTGKEGMGYGDFKLLAALGAWYGWQMLPAILLLSSLLGAAVGIALILSGRRACDSAMPFGPFLAIAGLVALFFGPQITWLYLG
ncbi:PulO Type II secretory pathway, prepilin signal peptidase PulO and related peptidases [Methylophilaceae bacterium]